MAAFLWAVGGDLTLRPGRDCGLLFLSGESTGTDVRWTAGWLNFLDGVGAEWEVEWGFLNKR